MKNFIYKIGFKLKEYSPEILVGAGIVGTVVSTVLACKATTKVEEIIENKQKLLEDVATCMNDPEIEYDEEDKKKDLTIIYARTGLDLVKNYAPAIAVGVVSIGSILAGFNIIKQRQLALTAAYAAVSQGFKKYRENVVERYGEDIDRELRHGIKSQTITETIVNEDGTEEEVEREVKVVDPISEYSSYSKWFNETSPNYSRDSEFNLMFLRRQQDYANEMLKSRGYLFLNDVYDMLGFNRTRAGHIVGWMYEKNNPIGDNYVDFGIYDPHKQSSMDFINGYEHQILLDFNVDGPIYNRVYPYADADVAGMTYASSAVSH